MEKEGAVNVWEESKVNRRVLSNWRKCLGQIQQTSPLSIALKPNGSGQVVIDMSAPHLAKVHLSSSVPSSLNSGINIEEFLSSGSSTKDVLKALEREGRGYVLTKIDWQDAYKHVLTHPEDQRLQTIHWAGMYFVELYLTFGCKSSPGIYDRILDIVLRMICLLVEIKRRLMVKQLNNAVHFGNLKSSTIYTNPMPKDSEFDVQQK